jgi:hypothetical protein
MFGEGDGRVQEGAERESAGLGAPIQHTLMSILIRRWRAAPPPVPLRVDR